MKSYKITIDNFNGGFAPGWWATDYPSYGNKNMAGDMLNIDLTNPSSITQGPGLSTIDSTNIDTLINSILDFAVSSGKTFGVGGDKFYEITPVSAGTASTPALPHTIAGTSVSADDVCLYEGWVYYSYQTNASGNVGRYSTLRNAEANFDDDWATVSGSAHLCASCPIPLCPGGNRTLYIGSGNRISSFTNSTSTFESEDYALPADCEIQDLAWNEDRLFIAANRVATQGFYLGQLHTAGNLSIAGANRAVSAWTSTDYVLAKKIQLGVAGSYRVSFSAYRYPTSPGYAYVRLSKNYNSSEDPGTTLGTYSWIDDDLYERDNLDFDNFAAGDTISMLIKMPASCTGHTNYLKLYVGEYYTGEPAPTVITNL